MSGLEIPGFLIGVAGLFSSCVDAFAYFKLAQDANREIEVVLLKLDIEKTRLLIWGENVGIFSNNYQDHRLLDECMVEIIQRTLSQIESLLTDSETLRNSYGAQTLLDAPLERAVDYISSKSIDVFRRSARRFWTRNASNLTAGTLRSRLRRTKWAIYEREKFQPLVNDLSHFVDKLFELSNVSREVQDEVIIEDITSILDISKLDIIHDATEDSYQAYSEVAASVQASTEAGTIDRRTVEEHLRDVEGIVGPDIFTTLQMEHSDSLWSEVKHSINYIVLTSKCRKLQSQHPCDVRLLGSQVTTPSGFEFESDISSKNLHSGNSLGQLINRLIDVKSKIRYGDDNYYDRLPFINFFIYCSPCVSLIHTALSVCKTVSSRFVKVCVRPDDRLASSCCNTVDRTLGLRSTLEWVREWESMATPDNRSPYLNSFLDNIWLDRRLDHLDYEQPYNYEEQPDRATRVLIIGEVDYLTPLVQKAPGRVPNATDIWHFEHTDTDTWRSETVPKKPASRKFFGRFIESRFVNSQATPRVQMPAAHQQLRVRRLSDSVSSDSKRRKAGIQSVTESGDEAQDKDRENNSYGFEGFE